MPSPAGAARPRGQPTLGQLATMVVGGAIGKMSMEAVSRSILIFHVPMLIVLGLVTYLPALAPWLPSLLLR